ncbi:uridine kinase [Nocardia sp. NPDC051787]|uniref:uridine kinase n=1 Tax=Nocardia sp. NPDC051787 TaxID=3155415 RepID=UPI0034290ACA
MVDVFQTIAARILKGAAVDRALVAVDGVDGSGKTTFTTELVRRLHTRTVIVLHADDFLNPSAVRHARGRRSPQGFWLDSYNYRALRRDALDPLRPGGDGWYRTASYDPGTDTIVRPTACLAPRNAVVVVEGLFLHRDELVDIWDMSIFLDVPFEVTARRMAERDGLTETPEHETMRRYVDGQRLYFARSQPWARADIVIDNTRFDQPRIIAPEYAHSAH